MDLVEDEPAAAVSAEKGLGIVGVAPDPGQVTVEIVDVGQRTDERRFAEASRASQPDDTPLPPLLLDAIPPNRPVDGMFVTRHDFSSGSTIAYGITKRKPMPLEAHDGSRSHAVGQPFGGPASAVRRRAA